MNTENTNEHEQTPIETPVDLLNAIVAQKKGGEAREQQKTAVRHINDALVNENNLVLEAPTGSGKTLSYLIPAIFQGSRVVVSTATKQLGSQIVALDLPFLQRAVKKVAPEKKFTYVLLKGRDNYFCKAKAEEMQKLSNTANSLFDIDDIENTIGVTKTTAKGVQMAKEIKEVTEWADKTKTGDRAEAPPVSDQTWRQFSSTTAECPGRNVCPLADVCFAERARDRAKEAQVVVTNHALIGHDLQIDEEGDSMFGDRDAYIFDEMHELDSYLTNAWGTTLSKNILTDALKVFKTLSDLTEKEIEEYESVIKKFNPVVKNLKEGRILGEQPLLGQLLARLFAAVSRIATSAGRVMKDTEEGDKKRKLATTVAKTGEELLRSTKLLLDDSTNTVRWVTLNEENVSLNAAPLRIGPQLQEVLERRNTIMIGTSATIRVGGDFEIPSYNLGLTLSSRPYNTVALDSPFDYKKQAMIYIPSKDRFPEPVGADRTAHFEAAKQEIVDLVKAGGGRALILCTTSYAARENGAYIREKLPKLNVLIQGEAPNEHLIEEFKNDERSVLVATMGLWQGVDIQGPSLSLVICDKIPFQPMNDPLSVARQEWAESQGRNGFMDIYVASATTALAQGCGRLVRSQTDRGVIAILDTRLVTKRYGQSMLKSLPDAKIFQNKDIVVKALERLDEQLSTK